jgi:hypothetical protein
MLISYNFGEIQMKILLILIFIIMMFIGCIGMSQNIIIDDSLFQTAPRDPISINDVYLQRNFMIFNVSYGGGCEEHIFQLIATSFMESYPVQVNILLSHEDNDDPCDMWVTETIIFNMLPLKKSYQRSYHEEFGTIIMNIEGWNESINYDF